MPRALLSVSDKTGLIELARGLAGRGFTLIATGGTADALGTAGLPVIGVEEVTGFPEMMGGRVKTLHPAVHAGILARRHVPGDLAALAEQRIEPVDLVVVNLYPFEATARQADVPFDDLVEQIDIGGPSLVRAAAKNFRDVLVVVDPQDYPGLLAAIDAGATAAFRFELMRKAFAHTAHYDAAVTATLGEFAAEPDRFARTRSQGAFDDRVRVELEKIGDLRYGENPHQRAAWYRHLGGPAADPEAGFGKAALIQGKELSYTNLLDLDAAARIVAEFAEPAAAVVKHTNPCGVATGVDAVDAYLRARDADPLSAFGGIVALNRAIDAAAADAIVSTKIDVVVAPAVQDEARQTLGRRRQMRVVIAGGVGSPASGVELRSIVGAVLVQARDLVVEARALWSPDALPDGFRIATKRAPTPGEWDGLRFAWRVCAHVKSNAVVFAGGPRTLAIGAGQMSRVDAVHVAILTARDKQALVNSVAATDGYFPFRDGVDAVASAGATAVIHPGGSLRDAEVIAAADEHGLAMVLTGRRHFRH